MYIKIGKPRLTPPSTCYSPPMWGVTGPTSASPALDSWHVDHPSRQSCFVNLTFPCPPLQASFPQELSRRRANLRNQRWTDDGISEFWNWMPWMAFDLPLYFLNEDIEDEPGWPPLLFRSCLGGHHSHHHFYRGWPTPPPLEGFSFSFFFFFRAAPVAYGSSQARCWIRAAAATATAISDLWHHLWHLWPTPQLTAMPVLNPLSEARDRTWSSRILVLNLPSHNRNSSWGFVHMPVPAWTGSLLHTALPESPGRSQVFHFTVAMWRHPVETHPVGDVLWQPQCTLQASNPWGMTTLWQSCNTEWWGLSKWLQLGGVWLWKSYTACDV